MILPQLLRFFLRLSKVGDNVFQCGFIWIQPPWRLLRNSWMCRFMYFIKFGMFSDTFSSNILSSTFPLSSPSGNIIMYMLFNSVVYRSSVKLCSFKKNFFSFLLLNNPNYTFSSSLVLFFFAFDWSLFILFYLFNF